MSEETFEPKGLADFEGGRQNDIEENLRKQDAKRQRIVQRHGVPRVMQTGDNNDPGNHRLHSDLNLPPPRIRESELTMRSELTASSHTMSVSLLSISNVAR